MNKSALKALFINAKVEGARYIGVKIATEGSSETERASDEVKRRNQRERGKRADGH